MPDFINTNVEKDVDIQRQYLVVKSNDLIQRSRYSMPLSLQKAFAYILSLVRPPCESKKYNWPQELLTYSFDIRDYCKVCGINYSSGGSALVQAKHSLKALADESIYIDIGNEKEILCRWIDDVEIDRKTKIVTIRLGKHLCPYLFNLKERFTEYELWNILMMQSAYSIRLYELLKSYINMKEITFTVDELRRYLYVHGSSCKKCRLRHSIQCLDCDAYKTSYTRFYDFNQKILKYSVEEINHLTDLLIGTEVITKGHSAEKIRFTIKEKPFINRYLQFNLINQNLNKPGKERIKYHAKNHQNHDTKSGFDQNQSKS